MIIKCVKDHFTPAQGINPQQQMIDNLSCRRDWNQFYSLQVLGVFLFFLFCCCCLLLICHRAPENTLSGTISLPEGTTYISTHPDDKSPFLSIPGMLVVVGGTRAKPGTTRSKNSNSVHVYNVNGTRTLPQRGTASDPGGHRVLVTSLQHTQSVVVIARGYEFRWTTDRGCLFDLHNDLRSTKGQAIKSDHCYCFSFRIEKQFKAIIGVGEDIEGSMNEFTSPQIQS